MKKGNKIVFTKRWRMLKIEKGKLQSKLIRNKNDNKKKNNIKYYCFKISCTAHFTKFEQESCSHTQLYSTS